MAVCSLHQELTSVQPSADADYLSLQTKRLAIIQ